MAPLWGRELLGTVIITGSASLSTDQSRQPTTKSNNAVKATVRAMSRETRGFFLAATIIDGVYMPIRQLHHWDVTPAEAIRIQNNLRARVIREDDLPEIRRIGGVDVGFEEGGRITRAAVVVLAFPALDHLDYVIARQPTRFPYVPGLLSFREVPAVLDALERLAQWPDVLLCDGQGIAHPRRLGIASHLGLITGLPSIGVGKSRLTGHHLEPGPHKGDWSPLVDGEETIGAVLRTRIGVKPLFISIGHRISLATAIDLVLAATPRYRLPETTRWADRLASRRGRTR